MLSCILTSISQSALMYMHRLLLYYCSKRETWFQLFMQTRAQHIPAHANNFLEIVFWCGSFPAGGQCALVSTWSTVCVEAANDLGRLLLRYVWCCALHLSFAEWTATDSDGVSPTERLQRLWNPTDILVKFLFSPMLLSLFSCYFRLI